MATKEEFLSRIRNALTDCKAEAIQEPPIPTVWTHEGLSVEQMVERFSENLKTVSGEIVVCEDRADATRRIRALFKGIDANRIGVLDRPLSRCVVEKIPDKEFVYASQFSEMMSETALTAVFAEELARLDTAIVSPEFLLADTGSCLLAAPTAFDRLLTYITPVLLIVASNSMLRETLPAAWSEIKSKLTEIHNGEFVIVTGPSRTADIEKVLILGVHGPKRVIVFLINE